MNSKFIFKHKNIFLSSLALGISFISLKKDVFNLKFLSNKFNKFTSMSKLECLDSNNSNNTINSASQINSIEDFLKQNLEQNNCKKNIQLSLTHLETNHNSIPDTDLLALKEVDYINCSALFNKFLQIRNEKLSKFEKEDPGFVKTIAMNMSDIIDYYVDELNIEYSRNLKDFELTPSISSPQRKELTSEILKTLLKVEKEVFITHDTNNYVKGNIFKIGENFKNKNENSKFKEAGVYNDFPDCRLVYKNKLITLTINDLDHLKFKINYKKNRNGVNGINSNANSESVTKNILYLLDLVELFEKNAKFKFDSEFGYLNTDISNTGNGLNINMKINLHKSEYINKVIPQMEKFISENPGFHFDISNESTSKSGNHIELYNTNGYVSLNSILLHLLSCHGDLKALKYNN